MNSGNLLRNRYRIEKALATGGFGETYLAIDLDYPGQRQVLVKQLKPAQSDPATLEIARRLFESEAHVLADLGETSNRLPALYAYFEEQGEFYLVQEFIAGQTLTMDLAGCQLSEAQTIEILQEILVGLQVVHGQNKIHRDLKPDNIMRRTSDGKLVLIDFGAVKEVRRATNLSQNALSASIGIGTAGYMPPEQAIGFPRLGSDVYAVGAIGIQCLTGEQPHKLFDQDALVLRWQHLCQVSVGLAAVLEKMVAPQVQERYRDGIEAAEAIEKLFMAPLPSSKVIAKPLPIAAPVVIQAPTPFIGLFDFGSHKFLKFLMVGGAGLLGITLLVVVLSLVKTFTPETQITKLSTDVASSPSPTTPLPTANNDNNDTSTQNNRKLTESEVENKEKEIADYDKAISINPQNAQAYLNRGLVKSASGKSKEAIADYDKALSINSQFVLAYYNRGSLKSKLGKSQEAISDYDIAISLDPQYTLAYFHRGFAKYKFVNSSVPGWTLKSHETQRIRNRYTKEAIADYDKAISLDPQYTLAYFHRGLVKTKVGENKEAIADYDKAISLDPQYALAYFHRGLEKSQSGKSKEAIADYDKAISLDPRYALAYFHRGLAKHRINKREAIADYDKAISLDPQFARAYFNRGFLKSLLGIGKSKETIADYKKAADLYLQAGDMNGYQVTIEIIKDFKKTMKT